MLSALGVTALAIAPTSQASAKFTLTENFNKTPAKISKDATPTFTMGHNVHFGIKAQRCKLDAKAWRACNNPWKPGHVADGVHTVRAMIVMSDGRTASDSYTWRIDTAAPTVPTVSGAMMSWGNDASRNVNATSTDVHGSGVAHIEYRFAFDAAAQQGHFGPVETGAHVVVTHEGFAIYEFRAVDKAGNHSAWVDADFGLDWHAPTAPGVRSDDTLDAWTNQDVTVAGFGADDTHGNVMTSGGSGGQLAYQYRISASAGESWSQPQDGDTHAFTQDGDYLIEFRATDEAANTGDWSVAAHVKVDKTVTAPTVTGTLNEDESIGYSWAAVTDSGSGFDHYLYEVSGDGGQTWGQSHVFHGLTLGASPTLCNTPDDVFAIRIAAVDAAGNVSWSDPVVDHCHANTPDAPVLAAGGPDGAQITWDLVSDPQDGLETDSSRYRVEYQTPAGSGSWLSYPQMRYSANGQMSISLMDMGISADCQTSYAVRVAASDSQHLSGKYSNTVTVTPCT